MYTRYWYDSAMHYEYTTTEYIYRYILEFHQIPRLLVSGNTWYLVYFIYDIKVLHHAQLATMSVAKKIYLAA